MYASHNGLSRALVLIACNLRSENLRSNPSGIFTVHGNPPSSNNNTGCDVQRSGKFGTDQREFPWEPVFIVRIVSCPALWLLNGKRTLFFFRLCLLPFTFLCGGICFLFIFRFKIEMKRTRINVWHMNIN